MKKIYGGDFFSSFKNIANKALPYLGKINKGLKDTKAISRGLSLASAPASLIHPGLGTAAELGSDIAKAVGYGKGGVLVGGQMADMNAMKRRLRNA